MRHIAGVVLLVTLAAPMLVEAKETAEWCEAQWRAESGETVAERSPDFVALLTRWRKYAERCAGTVAYEARLAIALLVARQPDEARDVLRPLMGKRTDYAYLVEFASLQIEYFTDLIYQAGTLERARRLEEKFRAYVQKYPAFPDGHGILGGLQTTVGKHAEAINSLNLGRKTSMQSWGVFSNLAISYTALGRYREGMEAADEAYRLNPGVTSDQMFMYALAKANAALGDGDAAENALRLIAAKKPAVRKDPAFKEAVEFVMARIQAKKTGGGAAK